MKTLAILIMIISNSGLADTRSDFSAAKPNLAKFQKDCQNHNISITARRYTPSTSRIRSDIFAMKSATRKTPTVDCSKTLRVTGSTVLSHKRFLQFINSREEAAECFHRSLKNAQERSILKLLRVENIHMAASSTPTRGNLSDICHSHEFRFYLKNGILLKFSFSSDYSAHSSL